MLSSFLLPPIPASGLQITVGFPPGSEVPFSNQFISHVSEVSDVIWISREMTVDEVLMGSHQVKVILKHRNEEIDDNSDIILTDVELVIRYD